MPIWHLEFKESELERDENNEHFLQVNAVMHFLHNSQYKYRLVMVTDKQNPKNLLDSCLGCCDKVKDLRQSRGVGPSSRRAKTKHYNLFILYYSAVPMLESLAF